MSRGATATSSSVPDYTATFASQLFEKLQGEGRVVVSSRAHLEEDVRVYGLEKTAVRWSKARPRR